MRAGKTLRVKGKIKIESINKLIKLGYKVIYVVETKGQVK